MNYKIQIQIATQASPLPTPTQLKKWVKITLNTANKTQAEVTLRLVDIPESEQLNTEYRHKKGPTNVLSFPYNYDNAEGDIAICAPLVQQESKEQNKTEIAHWAHLVIHGTLHLCGYDHIVNKEAEQMEKLEITILAQLGFANPYEEPL